MSSGLLATSAAALRARDVEAKLRLVGALVPTAAAGAHEVVPVSDVGRPARPVLVAPRELATRSATSPEGRLALVHAVAHIELNAVNLALDAVQRFPSMPEEYRADWVRVAQDEGRHFSMLRERLRSLGADYGDLPAHDGLWQMAVRTADDPLVRMALVPRVLEARGLDVTPGMISRLRLAGDLETVAILEVILAEEVGHVEVGTRWFRWLCSARGLDPLTTWRSVVHQYGVRIAPPFNETARAAAGFMPAELAP